MRDLYKRLELPPDATENQVLNRLAAVDDETREAATLVLLDSRRRVIYDRNHRVLSTIGTLRSHLAMNLKPFWARSGCGDFSQAFMTPAQNGIDPLAVIRAAGGRRRIHRDARAWVIAVMLLLAIVAAAIAWHGLG